MKLSFVLSLLMAFTLGACASKKDKDKVKSDTTASVESTEKAMPSIVSSEELAERTESWDQNRKDVLDRMVEKYGQPNEVSGSTVTWFDNGPWNKTIVHNEEGAGMIEQFADLNVPPEKLGDLALFNRSVNVDRNAGLISSRANREELNFLALNLSKEIVDGNMSPMEARRQYSTLTNTMQKNRYTDSLNFGSTESATGTGSGSMQSEDERSSEEYSIEEEEE